MSENGYYEKMKTKTTDKIKHINTQIDDFKDKLFNMNIPQHLEVVLRNRIRFITIVTGTFALIALFFMFQLPSYFITSLLVGFIAMIADFIIEYVGISKNSWDYPSQHISNINPVKEGIIVPIDGDRRSHYITGWAGRAIHV